MGSGSVGFWEMSVRAGVAGSLVSVSTSSVTLAGAAFIAGTKPTGARPGGRV